MKQNPPKFYRIPNDVVRDRRFSDAERLEILAAWGNFDGAVPAEIEQVREAQQEVERKRAEAATEK